MGTLSQITWMTLLGLSMLFVGGFVLWVYGAQRPRLSADAIAQEDEVVRKFHTHLAQWFLLYGAVTTFAGVGCLLTAAMMVI